MIGSRPPTSVTCPATPATKVRGPARLDAPAAPSADGCGPRGAALRRAALGVSGEQAVAFGERAEKESEQINSASVPQEFDTAQQRLTDRMACSAARQLSPLNWLRCLFH